MIKKMMLLALSVGALVAFMAPAAAQANVELTNAAEETVGVNTSITATSTNLKTVTANGTLSCNKVTLHFNLDVNGLEHVVLSPVGEATTEGCTVNGAIPATITDGTVLEELTVNTWGTSTVTASFASDVVFAPLGIDQTNCTLEGKLHVQGQASGSDLINVGPSKLTNTGGTGGCAEEGTMSGEFTLEESNGSPVFLDFVETG